MTTPRLQLTGISKRYPAVLANDAINLTVLPGEIHAVLGENGAGKSTLMKIIYGAVQPDAGTVHFNGRPVRVASPAQARALGISMVYQHFSLFDSLTAAQNVWLGLDKQMTLAQVAQRMHDVASSYGLPVDPQRPVHTLSVGERQRVEIVRALLTQPQLLILDEPTSVLTPQAVDSLFATLRLLAAQGCSILYISHKLDEIRRLCQRCTVLRAGRVTGEVVPALETNASLSRLMIGAEPPALPQRPPRQGPVVLRVHQLQLPRLDPFGTDLHPISFDVHAGEVLGLAGVSGNGQQELMAALSGEDPRAQAGSITFKSTGTGSIDISKSGPAQRRALGLHWVPEERLGRGAVPSLSLAHNTWLTRTETVGRLGWLHTGKAQALAQHIITRFGVKAGGPQALASSLSGGNLQKFLVGREVQAKPQLLIVSQPTWGVDVGAAAQIRSELLALREQGCAVLVVSEELEELMAISDRLVVMAKGRLSPAVPTASTTLAQVGQWMSGLWDEPQTVSDRA
jgi:general nucleoside transport system ATP-binding protein